MRECRYRRKGELLPQLANGVFRNHPDPLADWPLSAMRAPEAPVRLYGIAALMSRELGDRLDAC